MKFSLAVLAVVAPAMAFHQAPAFRTETKLYNMEKGAGGMFDTRNPDTIQHEDPRKSISAAPSFEEYMKQKQGGSMFDQGAPAAPAAPAAPPAYAPPPAAPAAPAAPAYVSSFAAPAAPAAPAYAPPAAAAPATPAPVTPAPGGFQYGLYDDQLWDNEAKKDVYNRWDPNTPRSTLNFNPFETFGGNSPDASGIYPGEPRYKDPKRGDVSYAIMMEEKAEAEQRAAAPKPGSAPGCPGCKN